MMKKLSTIPYKLPAGLVLSFAILSTVNAQPAQTGSCPTSHGHQHMSHDPGEHLTIKSRADAECSSCHGLNGISVSDNIPNLAGQESLYLCGWMIGCRAQGNQCEGHEDIATKYSDQEIIEFSEYYQHLPSAKP